jgi:hypothetical protein
MILFRLNWFYLKLGKELVRKYKNKEKEMQQKIFDCSKSSETLND